MEALKTIPRLSKSQFRKLNIVTKWLVVTRAAVLIITILSCGIVGLLAKKYDKFDLFIWLLVSLGLILAHATNNILNDFVDWKKGVDQNNYFRNRYGTHPCEVLDTKEMYGYLIFTGSIALSIGIYLCFLKGMEVVLLTIFGAFFLLFYTYPLKYIGMGEISVFVTWGILMIGGGYYTITGIWSTDIILQAMPYSLGVTLVIFGKHIDKLKEDKKKNIFTLPVILGDFNSRILMIFLIILQYIGTAYLIYTEKFSYWLLIVFFGLIDNYRYSIFKNLYNSKPEKKPKDYPQNVWPLFYVAFGFVHNRTFGTLFLIGLILDTFVPV